MAGEIAELKVRTPELGMDAAAGAPPRIYGRILDEGCVRDIGYLILHPTANFMNHYLMGPLHQRGRGVLGLNTRYVNNETSLIVERVIQDIGAGVRFLRERGYKKVVYIGNSGGGSIGTLYQSQAEKLTIDRTPDGLPIDLRMDDFPPVDKLVLASCHIGRARHFGMSLDPAVLDERDLLGTDPSLDMFNPENGPAYDRNWLKTYADAQMARHQRITNWVQGRLRQLDHLPKDAAISDEPFIIHRTYARPQTLDLTIDPNDRPPASSTFGGPRAANYSPTVLGRLTTLRSYMSQWSQISAAGDGPASLRETTVPVLNIRFSADEGTYPNLTREYTEAAAGRVDEFTLQGAQHFPFKQPDGEKMVAQLADAIVEWS